MYYTHDVPDGKNDYQFAEMQHICQNEFLFCPAGRVITQVCPNRGILL